MSGCLAVPAAALSVALEPIQDLHGYDNPWAAGGGKNKINAPDITLAAAGDIYNGACVLEAGTYTLSSSNTTVSVSVAGETGAMPITFTLANDISTIQIESSGAGTFNDIMIESGSTATTYEPYSNICPISGRTGSSVVAHGKNLIDNSSKGMYQATADSSVLRYGYTPITLKAGTYTVSYRKKTSASVTMYLTNMDTWNYTEISPTGTTVTLASDSQVFLRSGFTSAIEFDTEFEDAQIEYGSQATAYVPYVQPSTATLTFGTTVYGGQVDFKTGIVTVEWGYIASYNGETLPSEWISDRDAYEAGTTPTTGAEVAYKLATPTELTLTPALLTMLKGYNNISGDGVITITAYAINEEVGA